MATELDPVKRQAEVDDAMRRVQEDYGSIPLHQQTIVWAAKKNVDIVQPADNRIFMRWVNVH